MLVQVQIMHGFWLVNAEKSIKMPQSPKRVKISSGVCIDMLQSAQ